MSHIKFDMWGNKIKIDEGENKWWFNNKNELHREDGPAIEYRNGGKVWYHNDVRIGTSHNGFTQSKFERYLRELKIKEYW